MSADWIQELSRQVSTRHGDVGFLDAPVVGSRPQAEAAQLIYLVGGDAPMLERVEPILRSMGSVVHYIGPAGSGAIVKLAINASSAGQVAGAQFTPLFPVELVEKDLGYAAGLCGEAVQNPMLQAARQVMRAAMAAGWGGAHLTGIVRLYESS